MPESRTATPAPQPSRKFFGLRFATLVLWACSITVLSLVPNPPQPPGLLGWDKLQHAGAYGLLALLLARFIAQWHSVSIRAWWLALVGTVCFGLLLEGLQSMLQTGRLAEWYDVLADAVGALLACVIFRHSPWLRSHKKDEVAGRNG